MIEDTNTDRTEISGLGEFGLIDHLTKEIKIVNSSTVKGVGDDAAVIDNTGFQTLVSVDLLVEGVHFDLSYTPLRHLGYKAAAVNISDIAAMNGTARQMVVGIALSNRFSLEAVEEIYEGIRMACARYKVDLVGGDTTSSKSGLFLSVTVIGQAKTEDICYRSGANTGDLLCVSGDLGSAYMGLLLLEREKAVFKANPQAQPDLEGHDYVLERQLKPEPRADMVQILRDANLKPTSMIDISDGLASEILHLCKASETGCQIYEDKLPFDPTTLNLAEEFNMIPAIAALNGGEDYELLFTVSQSDFEKVRKIDGISIIGHMTANIGQAHMVTNDGQVIELTAQGWDALKKN
ncbi:MAG: thiamine-phosphate kinase [Bacteroidetes bacterium]|jgi:thiamine-monophosphate kinase|nr:thiamine-phosphate kinase [Bacteroidota bacterium]